MREIDRFNFLIKRDGLEEAIQFERQAAHCYEVAARLALKPMEDEEVISRARGKEWARIYDQAKEECQRILKEYPELIQE